MKTAAVTEGREAMLFETDFGEMSEAELRFAALRFEAMFRQTSHEEIRLLADEVDELRMRRMLDEPNPYERGGHRVANS